MAGDKWMSVQQALEWAFGKEGAQLELPEPDVEDRGFGFGMEYVLMEQARLGVRVDTFRGKSYPHEDADTIAAVVTHVSGGFRTAIMVVECARSGITPDWMPGAVPKVEPKAWKRRSGFRHYAKSERIGTHVEEVRLPHPKYPTKTIIRRKRTEILWTPIRWSPTEHQIASARKRYDEWWSALDEIRENLSYLRLTMVKITEVMPPRKPWRRPSGAGRKNMHKAPIR